jgi:rare lipoprotein A
MRGRVSAATSYVAALRRLAPAVAYAFVSLLLAHCSSSNVDSRWGVAGSPRVVEPGEGVPKGGGARRLGSAYVVGGRMYVPHYDPHYKSVGLASWYGEDFYGRYTANGEIFDLNAISAAHPTMPLPSYARVTNLANGHSLIVRVNDRGPYVSNRIIDVSVHAAKLLGFFRQGTAPVKVEYVAAAPLRGSDDRILEATLREDGPAPPPSTVRLASRAFAPALPPTSATAALLATAAGEYPLHGQPVTRAVSYADPAEAADGTASPEADDPAQGTDAAQFLSGRGLY